MKRAIVSLIAVLSLLSCKRLVFEDRTNCPSYMYFDVLNDEMFNTEDGVYATVLSYPKRQAMDAAVTSISQMKETEPLTRFHFLIRGTEAVTGYGLLGYGQLERNGSEWTAARGRDFTSLFRFSYIADVQEESFTVPVEFVKEYSRIRVQFVGYEDELGEVYFPYDVVVRGKTSGIDALTGTPVLGDFEYSCLAEEDGRYAFNLPRQGDTSLGLYLFGIDAITENYTLAASFSLYDILSEQGGVTWQEKNLPDVDITIDYQQRVVEVKVSDWYSDDNLSYEW